MLNNKFYDSLAEDYDSMTDLEKAVSKKRNKLARLLNGQKGNAADMGCGTGIDSIAVSGLGFDVTGFDPSIGMLKKAYKNAAAADLDIDFHNYAIDKIPDKITVKFNLIFSLGNTFANIEDSKVVKSIEKIFELLEKEGTFVMQVLNYNKILKERERIVNITGKSGSTFVRFYDFEEQKLQFNILKFPDDNKKKYEMISTEIYPHTAEYLETVLSRAGFSSIKKYGSLDGADYDEDESKDLVIKAEKI